MIIEDISYKKALSLAHKHAMEADPDVFVFGLDVPDHKQIFGSLEGIHEQFGDRRCFGTPLAEESMTGVALGAALSGLRPIHIHIRADFLLLAMNQLINMISNMRYMSAGELKVPILIRAIIGKGWGQSCQHSKSMHSIFTHFPGIKLIMPTRVQDAYSLTRTAIEDNNPIISLEHRLLYDIKGTIDTDLKVPLGKANILSEGTDLTLITTSWMAIEGLRVVEIMKNYHNISVELIDVLSISPIDKDTIVQSVQKTRKVVIADYDWDFCGFSSELASMIGYACFNKLDCPVERMGFQNVPCPTSRPLENLFYTTSEDIIRKIERMFKLTPSNLEDEEFYSYENKFKGPF